MNRSITNGFVALYSLLITLAVMLPAHELMVSDLANKGYPNPTGLGMLTALICGLPAYWVAWSIVDSVVQENVNR